MELSKMAITEQDVRHVANLAKLEFPESEIHGFTDTLGRIIEMVEMLSEVDTEGVPFTSNVVETDSVLREDIAIKGMPRTELLKNVPEQQSGFIKVPAILDDGGNA
jgi:aspartyl-tRNA(Asn)/glutamyl-tRNA(Gln) amidotransferase subunit C